MDNSKDDFNQNSKNIADGITQTKDGHRVWQNMQGQFHRIDGPAIEYADGSKAWLQHSKYHRVGGPAVEKTNGYQAWYWRGRCHRVDGPARTLPTGQKEWWINDKRLSEKEIEKLRQTLSARKEKALKKETRAQEPLIQAVHRKRLALLDSIAGSRRQKKQTPDLR